MNVLEQIELFYNANIIIAPHGAGSINLVFSKNLKIYVEIHNTNYISMDCCFFQICTILNIPYVNIHAESTSSNMHISNLIFENYDILKNILDEN
jgi:capsular polysaccharide biosynthesis protein